MADLKSVMYRRTKWEKGDKKIEETAKKYFLRLVEFLERELVLWGSFSRQPPADLPHYTAGQSFPQLMHKT